MVVQLVTGEPLWQTLTIAPFRWTPPPLMTIILLPLPLMIAGLKNAKEIVIAFGFVLVARWPGVQTRLVKSGMFRLMVAQKPTLAVMAGQKTFQNWPSCAAPAPNCEGCASMGPNPPAALTAHQRSAALRPISRGAAAFSTSRMDSMPRTMIAT